MIIDLNFDPKNTNKIIGEPLSPNTHWIMNTINTTLGWPFASDPNKIVKFYLVRSKVQFEFTFKKDGVLHRKPIGGELIDVSIPVRNDDNGELLKNYDNWTANYALTLEETGDTLDLKAESLDGVAQDIHGIVFVQYDRPWDGPKFQKRLGRLFLLSIINTLGTLGINSSDVASYLNQVQQEIITPLESLFPINQDHARLLAEKVSRAVQNLKNTTPDLNIFNEIWQGTSNLVNKMVNNPADDDEAEFQGNASDNQGQFRDCATAVTDVFSKNQS